MTKRNLLSLASVASLLLVLIAPFSLVATAQSVKLEGIIKGRSGNTLSLQTSDVPEVVVVLNDDTQVTQAQGAFPQEGHVHGRPDSRTSGSG